MSSLCFFSYIVIGHVPFYQKIVIGAIGGTYLANYAYLAAVNNLKSYH